MKPRHKRLAWIIVGVVGLAVTSLLVLSAFRNNIVFYYTPTALLDGKAPDHGVIRMGGLVQRGSVRKSGNGQKVEFVVTDLRHEIPVRYQGILPDLFRAGQGVVVQGRLGPDHVFVADQVLAKHDAKYMPPAVAQELHGRAQMAKQP